MKKNRPQTLKEKRRNLIIKWLLYLLVMAASFLFMTVTDIVEKFMNICLWIIFHSGHDIVDTTFGHILDKRHSCVLFEGFSYICAV